MLAEYYVYNSNLYAVKKTLCYEYKIKNEDIQLYNLMYNIEHAIS